MATILVGGHEGGAPLAPGRRLQHAVEAALAGGGCAVVVPMTFGRDPVMIADTAKTLQWLAPRHPGRVALAAPFGTADHLVALLRGAARRVGEDTGLIIAAPSSNPFDDAELHRLAHLVRVHGAGIEVEVALLRADAATDVHVAHDRLRRLGVARSLVVPAGFGAGPVATVAAMSAHGALLSDAAIDRIVAERARTAEHLLADHGVDGIRAGLGADHEHGYAHTHDHLQTHDHDHDPHDGHGHHEHQHRPAEEAPWQRGSRTTSSAAATSSSTPGARR